MMQLLRLSSDRILEMVKTPRPKQLEQIMRQAIPPYWERQREGMA